jgi:hypothetical protein
VVGGRQKQNARPDPCVIGTGAGSVGVSLSVEPELVSVSVAGTIAHLSGCHNHRT